MKKYRVKKKKSKPKKVELKPLQNQVLAIEKRNTNPVQKQIDMAIEKRNTNSVQKHIEKLKKAGQKKE